jgi:hypothetical protein
MQHAKLFYSTIFYLSSFLFSLQVAPVCMLLAEDSFEAHQLDGSLFLSDTIIRFAAMYGTGS